MNLNNYRKNTYSQGGEDGIIEQIFKTLGVKNGSYVEMGADDGMLISNTRKLREQGWKGVLIEGSSRFSKLEDNVRNAELINAYVSCEPGSTLDELLEPTSLPADFDLLSLDIDGNDLWIWKSLEKFRPNVVCVEYNYTLSDSLTIAYDANHRFQYDNYYGATCKAFDKLAGEKGYELIGWTQYLNLFYIDKAIKHPFDVIDVNDVPTGNGWKQSNKKMVSY